MPGPSSSTTAAAIAAISQRDLDAALRRAEAETPGPDQAQGIEALIPIYASDDPIGALRWGERMELAAPGTLSRTASAVYAAHPDRLDELRLCDLNSRAVTECRR